MFPRQIFAELMLHNVRKLSKKPVKVYCWVSCSAAAIYTLFGPAGPSKGNSVRLGLEEEAARTGKPLPEVAEEVRYIAYYASSSYLSPVTQFFTTVKGDLIRVPGMPAMYDHELHPQKVCSLLFVYVCLLRSVSVQMFMKGPITGPFFLGAVEYVVIYKCSMLSLLLF